MLTNKYTGLLSNPPRPSNVSFSRKQNTDAQLLQTGVCTFKSNMTLTNVKESKRKSFQVHTSTTVLLPNSLPEGGDTRHPHQLVRDQITAS